MPETATWLQGKNVLVAGLDPIGLLATIALRLRGANVHRLDVVDADTIRPRILRRLGHVRRWADHAPSTLYRLRGCPVASSGGRNQDRARMGHRLESKRPPVHPVLVGTDYAF